MNREPDYILANNQVPRDKYTFVSGYYDFRRAGICRIDNKVCYFEYREDDDSNDYWYYAWKLTFKEMLWWNFYIILAHIPAMHYYFSFCYNGEIRRLVKE